MFPVSVPVSIPVSVPAFTCFPVALNGSGCTVPVIFSGNVCPVNPPYYILYANPPTLDHVGCVVSRTEIDGNPLGYVCGEACGPGFCAAFLIQVHVFLLSSSRYVRVSS